LKFSLVDLGCGFLQPIQKFTEGQINDDKSALVWATSDINTTKDISVFGPGYVNFIRDRTLEHDLQFPMQGAMASIIMRGI
jgi:hypothetical protein